MRFPCSRWRRVPPPASAPFAPWGSLRLKESDRFAGSLSLAQRLGCRAWSQGDDFFVEGVGAAEKFLDFTISASLDHRMVMASAVAGVAGQGCTIEGAPHGVVELSELLSRLSVTGVSDQVIAIDGPAGSGKSSVARALAEALGWSFLDTGAMYRAVTVEALARGVDLTDEAKMGELARRTHSRPRFRASR